MLKAYFELHDVALIADDLWAGNRPALGRSLQTALEAMSEGVQQKLRADADRVGALTDDAGQAAIFSVTQAESALDELPNSFARSLWVWLNRPAEFEHAEQVRYADEHRHGRMWDGFVCEPAFVVHRGGVSMDAFKAAIGVYFGSRNVEVETCSRSRPRLEGPDLQLVQAAIYREGRPSERKAFVNGQLDRLSHRPVLEAAITYEAATGLIEVIASPRETREALVRLFAEHLLSTPFQGERLRLRQFVLEKLRRPFSFPTDPEDGIEEVRVTLLRLVPFDSNGERLTLECMRGAERSIWGMAGARFEEHDPLQSGFSVTRVRFTIKFATSGGPKGGRMLPVTLSHPTGCDLKDRTDRERLIGEKYLSRWGFVRDV